MNLTSNKHIALYKYLIFAIITLAIIGKTIQKTVNSISTSKYELVDNSYENTNDDELKKIDFLESLFPCNDVYETLTSTTYYTTVFVLKYVFKIPSPPPEIAIS